MLLRQSGLIRIWISICQYQKCQWIASAMPWDIRWDQPKLDRSASYRWSITKRTQGPTWSRPGYPTKKDTEYCQCTSKGDLDCCNLQQDIKQEKSWSTLDRITFSWQSLTGLFNWIILLRTTSGFSGCWTKRKGGIVCGDPAASQEEGKNLKVSLPSSAYLILKTAVRWTREPALQGFSVG